MSQKFENRFKPKPFLQKLLATYLYHSARHTFLETFLIISTAKTHDTGAYNFVGPCSLYIWHKFRHSQSNMRTCVCLTVFIVSKECAAFEYRDCISESTRCSQKV